MNAKEIRVLMVEPGKHPRVTTLMDDLDSLQKAVSIGADYQGLIEFTILKDMRQAHIEDLSRHLFQAILSIFLWRAATDCFEDSVKISYAAEATGFTYVGDGIFVIHKHSAGIFDSQKIYETFEVQ